jgi:hypothetical protein
LVDVCLMVELWGHDSEIARWNEFCKMEDNNNLSDTDVSEIVLVEDWPSKLTTRHVQNIEDQNA